MNHDREKKPDLQRAQKMMRESLHRMLVRCGFTNEWDLFVVVSLAATSAVFTEAVGSQKIQTSDEIEKLVKFGADEFGRMLREDLTERMLKERSGRRH